MGPHLEYLKIVWCPYLKKDILLIENIEACNQIISISQTFILWENINFNRHFIYENNEKLGKIKKCFTTTAVKMA